MKTAMVMSLGGIVARAMGENSLQAGLGLGLGLMPTLIDVPLPSS